MFGEHFRRAYTRATFLGLSPRSRPVLRRSPSSKRGREQGSSGSCTASYVARASWWARAGGATLPITQRWAFQLGADADCATGRGATFVGIALSATLRTGPFFVLVSPRTDSVALSDARARR